jgi:hypothetical protein
MSCHFGYLVPQTKVLIDIFLELIEFEIQSLQKTRCHFQALCCYFNLWQQGRLKMHLKKGGKEKSPPTYKPWLTRFCTQEHRRVSSMLHATTSIVVFRPIH